LAYTTKTPQEFVANLRKKFQSSQINRDEGPSYDATINDDGSVTLNLSTHTLDPNTGEVLISNASSITIQPANESTNIDVDTELTRIPGLKPQSSWLSGEAGPEAIGNKYVIENSEDAFKAFGEFYKRGFLVADQGGGKFKVSKGDTSIEVSVPANIMAENKQKLNQWTNTPQKKSAFIKYMLKFNSNLQKFRAKHPKLAKLLPSDLTRLKIPVPVVGLFSVAALKLESVGDIVGPKNKYIITNPDGTSEIIDGRVDSFKKMEDQLKKLEDEGFEIKLNSSNNYIASKDNINIVFNKIPLKESPWSYFKKTSTCELVNLDSVKQEHISSPKKQIKAEGLMHEALAGNVAPRQPLTAVKVIHENGQATYVVLDGNTTTSIAIKNGWKKLPMEVIETIEAENRTEYESDFKKLKSFAKENGEKLAYLDNNGLKKLVSDYNSKFEIKDEDIIKQKAFTIIHKNKNGIVAFDQKGELKVYKNMSEFKIDKEKISTEKFEQPDIKNYGEADEFKIIIEGKEVKLAEIENLQKPVEELIRMRSNPSKYLRPLGIKTKEQLRVFDAYMEYVGKVQTEVQKLQNSAVEARAILDNLMDDIAGKTNIVKEGTDLIGDGRPQSGNHNKVPIKGIGRTMEKCLTPKEYNGNAAKLLDLARGTLEYKNLKDLKEALKLIKTHESVDKIYIKDNFRDPNKPNKHPAQYRDMNISIRFKNGQVAELQLHIKEMLQVKEVGMSLPEIANNPTLQFSERERQLADEIATRIGKKGKLKLPEGDFFQTHSIYELWRSIPSIDPNKITDPQQRAKAIEMRQFKNKLERAQVLINKAAWQKYLNRVE
jgi:hypothetical protein